MNSTALDRENPAERITLASLATGIHDIKPLNQTVLALVQIMDDPDAIPTQALAQKISMDQAVVARILKVANSPFYGMSGRITSIREALTVLGYRSLVSLAIALGLRDQFIDTETFKPSQLWPERVFVACFARHMAPLVKLSRDTAYSIGLLFDVGKLVFYTKYPEHFKEVIALSAKEGIPFFKAEQARFGFDYAQVGGLVCQACKIPPSIGQAIATHLTPDFSGINQGLLLAAGVELYYMMSRLGVSKALDMIETLPLFQYLGFRRALCEPHMASIMEEVQQMILLFTQN